jgi:uncharacterized protein (TIGR02145 family)
MKLTSVSGTYAPTIADGTNGLENFTTWHVVPSTYTKVAYRTSGTDTDNSGSGIGSSLTTTYDAYVASTQPAGTYVGQVKYTLVHPNMTDNYNKPVIPITAEDCPGGWVCYAPNSGEIIGSMDSISNTKITSSPKAGKKNIGTGATSINLIAPNYSRPGYGFAGWSTKWDAVSAYNNNETVYIYGPIETITTADLLANENINFSTQGLILYPVWIASAGNLQGTDGQGWTGCSSLTAATYNSTTGKVEATLSSVTALKDTRDNNVYAVARLADGKCWMVENLRLNAENSRGDANIAKAQGYGDATANNQGKFIGLADSEDNFPATNGINDSTDANSVYYAGTQSGTATVNIFKTNYASYRMPRYNNNNTNMANDATNSSGLPLTDSYDTNNDQVRWFGYGNYYSWSAAIADTAYYNLNNYHVGNTSICPNGWHLPEGGDKDNSANSEFWALAVASIGAVPVNTSSQTRPYYTGSKEGANATKILRAFPNNFVYSGRFDNSSTTHFRSSTGFYWSSSAYGSYSEAYNLVLTDSHVYPGDNVHDRQFGRSVRCVIQPLPNTI